MGRAFWLTIPHPRAAPQKAHSKSGQETEGLVKLTKSNVQSDLSQILLQHRCDLYPKCTIAEVPLTPYSNIFSSRCGKSIVSSKM